ncbi:MAG: hypothetical protein P9M03_10375 [Candidatus Theseobacter exili]|nr:hypothetical protein [Candidatus Theseobacter exili]
MYECYQEKICDGKETFPISWIILENTLYLAIWILAAFLLWPIWEIGRIPVLTVIWVLSVLIIQVLLKKHNCSGCYYFDKLCHLGWGKISSLLFKQDSGDPEIGKKLTLFYIVPPPAISILSLTCGILNHYSWSYWIILIFYVGLNADVFPVRKKGCGICAMKNVCPGSAVKK